MAKRKRHCKCHKRGALVIGIGRGRGEREERGERSERRSGMGRGMRGGRR